MCEWQFLLQTSHLCVVWGLMELLPSFVRARLSAAAVNSLCSPLLRCCFRALLHFVRSAARPSQDIVSMSTAFIYFFTQNIVKLINHFLVADVKASIVSNMVGLPHHQQQLPSGYMGQPSDQHHPSHHTPHAPVSPPQQMHPKGYNSYGGSEPPKLNHPLPAGSSMAPVAMTQLSAQMLPAQVSG